MEAVICYDEHMTKVIFAFTIVEAVLQLGVSMETIHRRIRTKESKAQHD